jgi:hypothetical protein
MIDSKKQMLICPKCNTQQNASIILANNGLPNYIVFYCCKYTLFKQVEIDRCLNGGHPQETILENESKIC